MKQLIGRAASKLKQRRRATTASIGLVALVATLVIAPTQMASAGTETTDDFGSIYYSSDSYAAAEQAGDYAIGWNRGVDIRVFTLIDDLKADGNGATLVVRLDKVNSSNVTIFSTFYELRNTTGTRTVPRNLIIPWPSGYEPRLSFYVCNGKNSSGANERCGATHGRFAP